MKGVRGKNASVATRISRRTLLKSAALAGAATIAAPAIVRNAFSSSGELNFLGWAGYNFKDVYDLFTKQTGIKVNFTEQPNPEAMLAQMIATRGQGLYDIVEPASFYTLAWKEQDVVQPWNESNIHMDSAESAFFFDQQIVDGKRYSLPSIWGTEAIIFSTKDAPQEYSKLSLSTLWDEQYVGKVTVRPHSSLAAIGRVLDAQGKLPKPFLDSYKDEESMRANWDVIIAEAIKRKKSVAQFWKSEDEARAAFLTNGCVIGLNWDSTGQALKQQGLPYSYMAPNDGAFGGLQVYMLPKDAKNVAQAEAWVNFVYTPDGSAALVKGFGIAGVVAKGAVDKLDPFTRQFYLDAYPGDAVQKIWWWPTQASWYLTLRNEYADRFQAA